MKYKYELAKAIREEADETVGVTVTVIRKRLDELLDIIEQERKRESVK